MNKILPKTKLNLFILLFFVFSGIVNAASFNISSPVIYNATYAGADIVVQSGGTFTINSDAQINKITVNNGGILIINSPYTLTVGVVTNGATYQVVDFQNGSNVIVNSGASLVVYGLMKNSNNSSGIVVDGTVTVNGNVDGGNGSVISGSGTLNTTGSIITDNSGIIFGSTGDCLTGPCSGSNLCSFTGTVSSNQTVCSNTIPSMLNSTTTATSPTYQWQSSTTSGGGFTDILTNGTSSTYTFSSALSQTTYYRLKIKSTCTAITSQIAITVTPTNTVGTSSSTPTLCVDTPLTAITHVTTGATGIGTVTGLPAGVTASWASNTITISGTPTVSGTFNYSIPLIGGCGSVNATGTINVKAAPVVPILNSVVLNCASPSYVLGSWSVRSDVTDYKVDVSRDSNFGSFVGVYNNYSVGTSPSTTTISNLIEGGIFYIRVREVNGCSTSAVSNVATITVPITTTKNGTTWSNGSPDSTKKAIFMAGGTMANITTPITACSCQIDSGVNVVVGNPVGSTGYLIDKNSNAILKLENGLDVLGTLTFENNASLIQVNNVVNTSSIIYKRVSTPMNNFDYTYWSSPVTGQTLKALVPNTLPDKYFSWGTTNWVGESPANIMSPPGKGYIIRTPKPGVYPAPYAETVIMPYAEPVQFVGTPNNGHYDLTINGPGSYNLIGNPYPSALSVDAFLTANTSQLDGTIYFWTHNTAVSSTGYASADYATYNFTGGTRTGTASPGINNTTPNGYIAAGQSFFALSKNTATGSVVFDNNMRVGSGGAVLDNSTFFRGTKSKTTAVEKNRVWLNLTNSGGAFKQMLVGYVTGATVGYDSAFDGQSFNGNTFVDFYSINENKSLTIQGRGLPFDANDQVPLGYRTTIAGTFEISIDHTDGNLTNQPVYVEDKVANVIHNLKNGSYSFTTAKGTFNDRFVLRYSDKALADSSLGNSDFNDAQKGLVVSVKNHKIKINSFDESIDKVLVYDLKGSLLYEEKQLRGNEFTIANFNSSEQFLIVMTQLSNGKWVTKEIVF